MSRLHLNIENFDNLLEKADSPVLLSFRGGDEFECDDLRLSDAARGRAVAVEAFAEAELSAALEIRQTPTYILINGGRVIKRTTGSLDVGALKDFCAI